MILNSTKVIQSMSDKNKVKKCTNWVRGKVFQEPEQLLFYRLFPLPHPRITEEKIFRSNTTDLVLQVQKKTFKSGKD